MTDDRAASIYIGSGPKMPLPSTQEWLDLPHGVYEGANRYDTDDEHVLHLWRGGRSWDLRVPRSPDDR